MLRRLTLRDVVIVPSLELELSGGFTALTGETGAGKSILIDALQLVLGARAEAAVVREGAARCEVSAEFDAPASLAPWLELAGLADEDGLLLLRRSVDAQGKGRAWVNGSPVTVAQLRELGQALVEIHGQHAWATLAKPATARELLDAQAGVDTAPMRRAFHSWREAQAALARARDEAEALAREREQLEWNLAELGRLGAAEGEWPALDAEHRRLSHAQALIEAAQRAQALLRDDDGANAMGLIARAADALGAVAEHDARLQPAIEALQAAQAQLSEAGHELAGYLGRADLDPARLAELDARMASWMGLARRLRSAPEALPALQQRWQARLAELTAAADLDGLQRQAAQAESDYRREAAAVAQTRRAAAPMLAERVTATMQTLGMAGGRLELGFEPLAEPQAHGLEAVEFLVAGHAGATPRPLGKVASGGELSRLALAIVVATMDDAPDGPTLIFDEIDAGVGGVVGDAVGALMRRLGRRRQVLAITHLAQVASRADHQGVVSKATQADGRTTSDLALVSGQARVQELARMLGGGPEATRLAHAQAMLDEAGRAPSAEAIAAASRLTASPSPRRGRGRQPA